jgi:hypothetical protein
MKARNKYATPAAMRTALEERLNRTAREKNQDILRLRRQVAFDRLLARIFAGPQSSHIVLKGGYALELRLHEARTTKDIDLCLDDRTAAGGALEDSLLSIIRDAAKTDLSDFFEFTASDSVLDLENAPYGGHRFPVECRMAGRRFAHFNIDIATGDVWLDTHVELQARNWLDFAGIETPAFPSISSEQQFAEKIHSYSVPRETPNSRTKDLVDMVLLIQKCGLDLVRVREAILKTFQRRKTHDMPNELEKPPESWRIRFKNLT